MRHREKWFYRADDGAGDAGTAVEEGVDTRGGGFDWGEQADTEYAKRFPGGPQEMWKSINAGTQRITQLSAAEQRAAELEAQLAELQADEGEAVWEDPLRALPDELDDATRRRLVMLFESSPSEAFDLAQRAAPGYGPALQNQIMQAWLMKDPVGAMQHLASQNLDSVLTERFQSFEEQLQERIGPMLAHNVTEMSGAAVVQSRLIAPDIVKYEERIEQAILGNPALISDTVGNVQGLATRLVQLRDMIAAGDARIAAGKEPVVEVEDAKKADLPKARPRQSTIGTSDARGPDLVDDDYAKRMSISPQRKRGRGAP